MRLLKVLCVAALLISAGGLEAGTAVPGHTGKNFDSDQNGYPDVGVSVNGHYKLTYAYDYLGGWYQERDDGEVSGNVGSIEDLDSETLSVCEYVVNYRGTFENDPYLDSGWVMNNIRCTGYDGNAFYKYLIVHESDPRYTGDPNWAIWGTWEYFGYVISGEGNLVRPESHLQ